MKFAFLILYILIYPLGILAQGNKAFFSGFVYDDESGEPIVGAFIYNETKRIGAVSNNYGYFSLNTPADDSSHIEVSCLGYITNKNHWNKNKYPTSIYLKRNKFELDEVVVVGNRNQEYKAGKLTVSMDNIKNMPSLTGEVDLLKAFQMMAGVQSGNEGSVGLIVRGGSNDQNLYLLDGVPLYYISHMGGISSVFDISTVKSSVMYKGFFPASYGGRLSSVVDVVLKDGNINKTKREVSVGLLSSKVFIEGALGKNKKLSYIVSGRICNIGLFTMLGNNGCYLYYDVNSKLTYRLNDKNKFYLSLYTGDDIYLKKDNEKLGSDFSKYRNRTFYGNVMLSSKWLHIFNSYLSSNMMFTYSNFHNINTTTSNYSISQKENLNKQQIKTSMQDLQVKGDLNYYRFTNHNIKLGFLSSMQFFRPQVQTYKEKNGSITRDSVIQSKIVGLQNDIYVEDTWNVNKFVGVYGGLRLSSFVPSNGKCYANIEPRFSIKVSPLNNFSINIGYSKMSQYIHLLSNNDGGIPKDLWLPSTSKVKPEISNQYELELQYDLPSGYHASVCGYFKKMTHLIDFGGYIQQNSYWEDELEVNGRGNSKGLEFSLAKEQGRLTGYISYTLSKSDRRFDNINKGEKYPFKYDHPHQLNLYFTYRLNEHLYASANWVYHTGNAITMSVEKYQLQSGNSVLEDGFGDIHIYSPRNSYRMPAYHRLDVGLILKQKKGEWHFGLYNVYNRMNPYYYYYQKTSEGLKMKQTTLFPFLPSIAYSFKF